MRKKAFGEVSSDIFCMVNQTKKQQNGAFFKLFGKDCSLLILVVP